MEFVSKVIAGTMRWGKWGESFTKKKYQIMINQCLDAGINTFDHADIYGDYTTESEFGDALSELGLDREKYKLITKCGIKKVSKLRPMHRVKSYDSSAQHISNSVEQSLRNLKTDYIDLLLLHRPDFLMDASEIADVMAELIQSRKVLHFGVSNFTRSQIELLNNHIRIENHQLQVSLNHREAIVNGDLEYCQQKSISVHAWSPLASGVMFGNDNLATKSHVEAVAQPMMERYGCTLDQLLISWILKHPSGITPVMGTTKILRLISALDAYQINLTREDWYDLWQAASGKKIA